MLDENDGSARFIGNCDADYLQRRERCERHMARIAQSDRARMAHLCLADGYAGRLAQIVTEPGSAPTSWQRLRIALRRLAD